MVARGVGLDEEVGGGGAVGVGVEEEELVVVELVDTWEDMVLSSSVVVFLLEPVKREKEPK